MNEHRTAITRKQPSKPMQRLSSDKRLRGRTLDYGCGKGFDVEHFGIEGYDPHYQPDLPAGKFETIVCNYVLNVIESEKQRETVLDDIQNRLTDTGTAYVTVRNDKRALTGSKRGGTWQGYIELDFPVVYRVAGFVTYRINSNALSEG